MSKNPLAKAMLEELGCQNIEIYKTEIGILAIGKLGEYFITLGSLGRGIVSRGGMIVECPTWKEAIDLFSYKTDPNWGKPPLPHWEDLLEVYDENGERMTLEEIEAEYLARDIESN